MLSLFQRKRTPHNAGSAPTPAAEPAKELTRPTSAASLLATPRRQRLLEHIWQRTSLSRRQFAALYTAPLERYAELVQVFPASESHHHSYPGGMLDHGLEIVAYALKLRQSHLLPAGAPPEVQAAQAEAWTAGAAYAALLHDIGKVAVDLHVEYADGTAWHPWHGPLKRPYRFRYRKEREYRLHSAATGLLYTQLLDRDILDWLFEYPELWAALLYVLAGQYEHAGTLGELVRQADQASVAHELGGDPSKALSAPRHALQRKLLDGLRYLVKEEFKVNQPQASDAWLTESALWLVSKTVSDKLRAHLLSQGIDGIPSSNTAVFNVLQDHGIALATPTGKAIWKATVTSETGWSHSFTFLKLSPALIWAESERPATFSGSVQVEQEEAPEPDSVHVERADAVDGGRQTSTHAKSPATEPLSSIDTPARPATVDGVASLLELLATPAAPAEPAALPAVVATESAKRPFDEPPSLSEIAEANCETPLPSGEHFMAWLKQGIASHRLIINDAKALVHTVSDTAFLISPGIFQRYAQEHPQIGELAKHDDQQEWQWVQKRFEKLQLHRKQTNGLNIWTCEVTGPRKSRKLHGYLLTEPSLVLAQFTANNPYLKLAES